MEKERTGEKNEDDEHREKEREKKRSELETFHE